MGGFDAAIRRVWPAVVVAALSAVAYFQTAGVMHLLAAEISTPPPPPAIVTPEPVATALSAEAILERNPFDSDMGPLGRFAPPAPIAAAPSSSALTDPTQAPTCELGYVTLITTAQDPQWSFAAIEPKGGESLLRRAGGKVNEHTVEYVAWDRVWLSRGSELCQLKLGDKPKVKKKRRTRRKRKRRGKGRITLLPKHIASKIHRRSATEYEVERSALDEILEDQFALLRSTRVRPVKEGGEVTGMRVSRVRHGTLLHTLGVRTGDVVQSISGFPLTDPQKALQAYGRLRTADHLALSLVRKGKPTTIDINIK